MNQLKTIALLGVLSAILIAIGAAVSPGAMWIFGGIAVIMNLAAYFWSDKLVLAMSRARPLQPGEDAALERMVAELAAEADIPAPRVYVIDEEAPNAFATGRNPEHGVVAVTRGIPRTRRPNRRPADPGQGSTLRAGPTPTRGRPM